jgi:predicted SnoaL-like aldol condensation-catalyzing enzyme
MPSRLRTAREVVAAYNLELWNEQCLELADELIADTMIRHEVGEAHTLTRAEALKRVTDTWAQMDSLRFDLNIVIDGGDGEHVAMVWDSTMAKDGNEVKVASIEVFRVVNGQIVEVWNCGYKLGVWE